MLWQCSSFPSCLAKKALTLDSMALFPRSAAVVQESSEGLRQKHAPGCVLYKQEPVGYENTGKRWWEIMTEGVQ